MNILAEIHGYPPHHNSGAEWMAHDIFKYLVSKGHEVKILLDFNSYLGKVPGPYEIDGVNVVSDKDYKIHYSCADIVFTHLDKTGRAYNRAREFGLPLVHLIHNHYNNIVVENMNAVRQYCIYNTHWIKEALKERHKFVRGSIVIHPPVRIEDYKIERRINNYNTLININKNKGGQVLVDIAKALPNKKFLGVEGSYGDQVWNYNIKNIHYIYNTELIKNVYKRTRILLMPSEYESYGRTAIEAASSGIPVICTPTDGLKEALGDAGIYCERKDVGAWVKAIRFLDNEKNYKAQSKKIFRRAEKMDPTKDLESIIKFLENEVLNKQNTRKASRSKTV